ncbi:Aste57867_12798 [Aphanomyces stellatus]|uniref:Aste57867_12798 protein n=1 Tax=Aphanomyces stellatus TaxID=120398 RepID=A0A485KWX6_9STRA|nr:hypothetical protein As57867_012750 [Aphanomyces stellatus]VFT89647.1 Aste57867_12798 [Aphanomyces stellatus]
MPPPVRAPEKTLAVPQAVSDGTTELKLLLQRPVRLLALSKHLVSSIYYLIMTYLYVTLSATSKRALQAYAPTAMVAVMGSFALLHVYGLFRTCRGAPTKTWFWSKHTFWPALCASSSSRLMFFHFVDVLCQSYQAYHVSEYLVDRTSAFSFAFFVSLNCLITPWFLVSKHKVVQESVVPLVQSLLGFILSTLFQAFVFIAPALYFSLSVAHQYDDQFNARIMLVSRYMLVSSPLDLVTKVFIQLSSYAALRKLVESIHVVPHVGHPKLGTNMSKHFQLEFYTNRSRLVYAVCVSCWGLGILGLSITANWNRSTCPTTCVYEFYPWSSFTRECAYVEINCAKQNTPGDTINSFLEPSQLGLRLFCIDIRRCALRNGISMANFVPFQHLYGLYISFSNMTQWTHDPTASAARFPESLTAFRISYSDLAVIPAVLAPAPPNLVYLLIEGTEISAIPNEYFQAWAKVSI